MSRITDESEAKEIMEYGADYALGYVIGILDDFANGDAFDRRWATRRARSIIVEWCKQHPTSPTARKLRGEIER